MSKQAWEFGFWALVIVGAATALIMTQHAMHSASIANMVGAGVQAGPPQTPQPQSKATGTQPPVLPGFFSFEPDPGYY
jgi:hypothetical protein